MATHKVPQDVETEDKLIGFLSLKQFIFVVVGLGFGYLTFFFATKVNVILALIWVPFTIVPLVLGIYQRKDQPVEVFLASALRFYFKPRKRKWDQEGFEERVVVTAPPKVEHHYTKDFTGEEAMSRLTRLSNMMDSRGWASKLSGDWQNPQLAAAATSEGRLVQPANLASNSSDYLQSYMQPSDVMDEQTSLVAKDFQNKIETTDTNVQVRAMKSMQAARTDTSANSPHVNKYPEMRQTVVKPIDDSASASSQPAAKPTQDGQKPAKSDDLSTQSQEERKSDSKEPVKGSEPVSHVTDDGSIEISLR